MQFFGSKKQIFGFIFVGLLTVLVNLITFQLVIFFNESIYLATLLGNLVSIAVNFSGLSSVFNSRKKIINLMKYLISWTTYYILTIQVVLLFISFDYSPLASRIFTLFILTPLSYLAQKYLIFTSKN